MRLKGEAGKSLGKAEFGVPGEPPLGRVMKTVIDPRRLDSSDQTRQTLVCGDANMVVVAR